MRSRRLLGDVQAAYSAEDLAALRAKVTPEMLSYFSEQLSENASRGLINRVTDVKLLQGDLAEAWREGDADYATVAMRFALTDSMVERAAAAPSRAAARARSPNCGPSCARAAATGCCRPSSRPDDRRSASRRVRRFRRARGATFGRRSRRRRFRHQRGLRGLGEAAFEFHADLVRLAPHHAAVAPRRAVARQQQQKVVGTGLGILDVDARAGIGDVGQHATVQLVGGQHHPGGVAERPALWLFVCF